MSSLSNPTVLSGPNHRKRKYKPRASIACNTCRAKKSKCDQGHPCQLCKDRDVQCVYGDKRAKAGTKNHKNGVGISMLKLATNSQSHQAWVSTRSHEKELNLGVSSSRLRDTINYHGGIETSLDSVNGTVAAVNYHNNGTELYGNSSNVVLVKQLLQYSHDRQSNSENSLLSRNSLENYGSSNTTLIRPTNPLKVAPGIEHSQSPMPVVGLLCDDNSDIPDARPGSPVTVAGKGLKSPLGMLSAPLSEWIRRPSNKAIGLAETSQLGVPDTSSSKTLWQMQTTSAALPSADLHSRDCFFGNPMHLEMEYVNIYFQNWHLVYPFLSEAAFRLRCQEDIWVGAVLKRLPRNQVHFLALYNAVLAIGALIAPLDTLLNERAELENSKEDRRKAPNYVPSSIRISKLYVSRTKKLLGDSFEVSSLEGAQTLLLLSVYCQHALRLHASYMYSGMAVRTAIAIGLSTVANTGVDTIDSRTWSCIYAQEIKVSCSSGRPVTLPAFHRHPDNSLSQSKASSNNEDSLHDSIIIAQLGLYGILRAASTNVYHSQGDITLEERSSIILDLDQRLEQWKTSLPSWLNPDAVSFDDSETTSRQKLALQMCFYQARICIHRPFLAVSENSRLLKLHVSTCLATAHAAIDLIYSAFTHRIYFRTWWYNAAHTFYATIIILYVQFMPDLQEIMSAASLNMRELSSDVQKSLKMLRAMDSMPVSTRYADLVQEVFNISQDYAESWKQDDWDMGRDAGSDRGSQYVENASNGQVRLETGSHEFQIDQQVAHEAAWDNSSHLLRDLRGLERDDLLLSLMDPNLLDDFTMGCHGKMSFDLTEQHFGFDHYPALNFASGENNDFVSCHKEQ